MKKYLFCYLVLLINVGYLKGQFDLICKKCPNNTVNYYGRCVELIPDGKLCTPYTSVCQNFEYSCIRKTVSSRFTCDKCNDNQFIGFNGICIDKITDDEICLDPYEQCLNGNLTCLMDPRFNYRCGKCAENQYIEQYYRKCENKIKDGEICSSNIAQCENPESSCLKLSKNDTYLRCGKCNENQIIDYINIRCVDKIDQIENGRICSNSNDFCKTPGYQCLRKNNNDFKFYCLKCGTNQVVDYSQYMCKAKIKAGKLCTSSYWDKCLDPSYSCLKKKANDTQLYCLKCKENQFINSDGVCQSKIRNGKACKKPSDVCLTKGFECVAK